MAVEKAFGLDKSDVIVEEIPFIYQQSQKIKLNRLPIKAKPDA